MPPLLRIKQRTCPPYNTPCLKVAAESGTVRLKVAMEAARDNINDVIDDNTSHNQDDPVLSTLVYTAQTLGIDPNSCGSCNNHSKR